ncbi:2'-5' RNA ligase family protein [Sagittula sp. S175]|uniref:2'-5' RNA ligase family protein n=1 Tax=Sagittula sp. S175 TaxID=3415129 RepID=UPI003C7C34F4
MNDMRPLILTCGFDAPGFSRFQSARQRHFPKDRNHIPAHLTLFHALPGFLSDEIAAHLSAGAADTAPISYSVTGLMPLGSGTAYAIDAPNLKTLHKGLQAQWSDHLTRQDAQGLRPHVTIQNKVDKETALATRAELEDGFAPWQGTITHLLLWHYDDGPWDFAQGFALSGTT